MSTYVSLINWTEQGVKNSRDTIKRAEDSPGLSRAPAADPRAAVDRRRVRIIHVAEFPDDELGVAALLELGSAGNIRARTLRAFNAAEMAAIISRTSRQQEHGSWG